jgi:hypothetical protein
MARSKRKGEVFVGGAGRSESGKPAFTYELHNNAKGVVTWVQVIAQPNQGIRRLGRLDAEIRELKHRHVNAKVTLQFSKVETRRPVKLSLIVTRKAVNTLHLAAAANAL